MNVFVTGANGFVGIDLCKTLVASGARVYASVRDSEKASRLPQGVEPIVVSDINDLAPLEPIADQIECIVHLAARVHQVKETAQDPLAEFRRINVLPTEKLARLAAQKRIKRFVFVSSVKVHGEGQGFGEPLRAYTEDDVPTPQDPYGISKWEAEQALTRVAAETGLETVILRPTLMYGPEVRANFFQLLRIVDAGLPIPLGSVSNTRSLLYVGNFVSAIQACIKHPRAKGQTFLVSDGHDLSTPELIQQMAQALGRRSRLLPIPPAWIAGLGRVTGKSGAVRRLLGSLKVDSTRIRSTLEWSPPFTVAEGLAATANWYSRERRGRTTTYAA